ncbi:hypothetical protein ASE48_24600 [Mycobacterium sp. Root265]|nr:hypothetical protein ASE48_24600 [Mycobacterium sp. Root265]
MVGVRPVGLLGRGDLTGDAAVTHQHRAQLPVEDAHDGAHAAFVRFGNGFQPDDQLDTLVQLYAVFITVAQAVEELIGRQSRGVAVQNTMLLEFP